MKTSKIPDQERIRMMRSSGMSEKDAVTKMASMKRPKVKGTKNPSVEPSSPHMDKYPYGLRIELDHEGMKKLGMKKLPKVGSKHKITAHAHVVSASESHHEGDKKSNRSASMQITHMALEKGEPTKDTESRDEEYNEQGNGLEDQ